jgi:hypothetical protein
MLARFASLMFVCVLITAGCSSDHTSKNPATSERKSGADGPAATGARTLDGQATTITVRGGRFTPSDIDANKGVVTLRLKNPTARLLRLGIREGEQVLTESTPASGEQVAEVTIPIEAGKDYTYYAIGVKDPKLSGTIHVDS